MQASTVVPVKCVDVTFVLMCLEWWNASFMMATTCVLFVVKFGGEHTYCLFQTKGREHTHAGIVSSIR